MDDNRKFWDRMAKLYAPIQERSNRRLYDAVIAAASPYLTSTASVLELGCGSGQLTRPLSPLAGRWEATDYSVRMVEEARKRCTGVSFSVQDATALDYPDASFDVVLIANTLHIMPEPEKALAEIRRVLKPEGILLAPTFVYEGHPNRLRMKLTELVGFRSYHHWTMAALADFLEHRGFSVTERRLLPGDPLPEAFVAAKRQ